MKQVICLNNQVSSSNICTIYMLHYFYHTLTFHLVQMSFSTTQSMHILHGIIWLWHIGHKDISFSK